ncbi:MAG: hypothetical protein NTV43_10060 [Methylococcales bacterium]|nr:hypothetical protein [Methylococcales bacterium]
MISQPEVIFNSKDAGNIEIVTDSATLPVRRGQVSSADENALALRIKGGFNTFNASYKNQWKASLDAKSGKVKVLYGTVSKMYKNNPEIVAKGFLKDSKIIFGLDQDLADLKTLQVDKTPNRNHVRFQQTYGGVPVAGAYVLVHSTPTGQVTMVQNDYIPGLQVANRQSITAQGAQDIARNDLQTKLGKGAELSDAKTEQLITPIQGKYFFVWKISIPSENPWGFWVYQIDSENGNILYSGNEMNSVRSGSGKAYLNNANWHLHKISNVSLKYLYTSKETIDWGYLFGSHAMILDYNGNDTRATDYKFLYDAVKQKDWFDATNAYYKMNVVWDWWKKLVVKYHETPNFFYNYSVPSLVNVNGYCNAFFTTNIGNGGPGFAFGGENSCAYGSEDLVLDDDIVRHEFTHAMMNWLGFDAQFGGPVEYYGRAMGEGNADWFGYILHPKSAKMADVGFATEPGGYLRNLDNTRKYPQDVDYPGWGSPEEHYTGEIWGGYLYDLYRVLGSNALPYIFNSYYYFSPAGGQMDGLPDFFDGIWAQLSAENDLTHGKLVSSAKAWGSMTARGINAALRQPYYSTSNYFYTGHPGSDINSVFFFNFPPVKQITTTSNLLKSGDRHEYLVTSTKDNLMLTVTVTAKSGGLVNPSIELRNFSNTLLASTIGSATKAVLKYPGLPKNSYALVITGTTSAQARGYYSITVSAK